MDNKMSQALLASALVLAATMYHSTLRSALLTPIITTPATPSFLIAQTSSAGSAFASPPVGYISEGLGAAITLAETEIVLANQLKPRISRAVFTHGITQREPIDKIVSISQSFEKVYFFTELSNFKGELIKHRWEHEGEVIAEVEFKIKSPRWRAYSSKNISSNGLGKWTVFVTNSVGLELFSNSIVVVN